MGSFDDGGYDLCTSPPYHFPSQSSCLVYSFGFVDLHPFVSSLCHCSATVTLFCTLFIVLYTACNVSYTKTGYRKVLFSG